jgi:hypothetical protein
MKKRIILSLLLSLPIIAFAQTESESEVREIKLNDFYSIRLKQICESEYNARKEASKHLQHEPYEVITNIAEAKRMLGERFKTIEIDNYDQDGYYIFPPSTPYQINFNNDTQLTLHEWDCGFVAYFPELEVLLFEGGHSSDMPFDLNHSADDYNDFWGHHAGNPHYHAVSPDKQLRINGRYDGQECVVYFIEKWNPNKKQYNFIGNLTSDSFWFCYAGDWLWTSSGKVLFKSGYNSYYYELELIKK